MPQSLVISFTFLHPTFHGRDAEGEPEWPPSPARAFQALVAGALGGCRPPADTVDRLRGALKYLESLGAPDIVAPEREVLEAYATYVPRNNLDTVLRNRAGGGDMPFSKMNIAKVVRPQLLAEPAAVRYVWPARGADEPLLRELANRATALGGGDDMVVCDAEIMDDSDPRLSAGERWAATGPGNPLAQRSAVVSPGALAELDTRHAAKLSGGVVPPPTASGTEAWYQLAGESQPRPCAAFRVRGLGDEAVALPPSRAVHAAAMLRHAAHEAATADPGEWRTEEWARENVAGHGSGDGPRERLSYLTLPSIGPRADGMIRRLLIAEQPGGSGRDAAWAASRLRGAVLTDTAGSAIGYLEPLPDDDAVLGRFVGPATVWSTATPVILPRWTGARRWRDVKPEKLRRIVADAIRHAGHNPSALADVEAIRSGHVSLPLGDYRLDSHMRKWPLCHLRLRFRRPLEGPLAIGRGGHRGLGVFVAEG